MVNVNSNVKLITSNAEPTTTNLSKGNLAFGQVNGENKIYGNIGDRVVEFTANGEPIIYFVDEEDLNTFLSGSEVPTDGWYAAIAEKLYANVAETVTVDNDDVYVNKINGGVDLMVTSNGDGTLHMSYGDYAIPTGGGSTAVRSRVEADIAITVIGAAINPDGTLTATVNTKYTNFHRVLVDSGGLHVTTIIHIYASDERINEVFTRVDDVSGGNKYYPDVSFNQHVTLQPNGSAYVGIGRYWNDVDSSTSDDEFTGGIKITYSEAA